MLRSEEVIPRGTTSSMRKYEAVDSRLTSALHRPW
jgi:hypothetical protein